MLFNYVYEGKKASYVNIWKLFRAATLKKLEGSIVLCQSIQRKVFSETQHQLWYMLVQSWKYKEAFFHSLQHVSYDGPPCAFPERTETTIGERQHRSPQSENALLCAGRWPAPPTVAPVPASAAEATRQTEPRVCRFHHNKARVCRIHSYPPPPSPDAVRSSFSFRTTINQSVHSLFRNRAPLWFCSTCFIDFIVHP